MEKSRRVFDGWGGASSEVGSVVDFVEIAAGLSQCIIKGEGLQREEWQRSRKRG